LTPTTQAKLLRVLEDRSVRRLGARGSATANIRLLAASNQDLGEEVKRGSFREDLFYRLNVVHIHLPELKERPEDIPLLAEHFLREFSRQNGRPLPRLSRAALDLLRGYFWPGNVRELKNMMEQAALLAPGEEIGPEDLPELGACWQKELGRKLAAEEATLEAMEKTYIEEVLRRAAGQKGRAAHILGIDRRTLYSKLHKYGLG